MKKLLVVFAMSFMTSLALVSCGGSESCEKECKKECVHLGKVPLQFLAMSGGGNVT